MNSFEVLGVALDATDSQIAAAYRQLAKQFHPDQHPEASASAKAQWQRAMSSINTAYEQIKDGARRSTYLATLRAQRGPTAQQTTQGTRSPRVGECDLCGHAPARPMEFQMQNAWVLRRTVYSTRLELCRDCGRAVGRQRQGRTLWSGWWGISAALANLGFVGKNSVTLRQAGRLATPRIDLVVAAPLAHPLSPGHTVFRRIGIWTVVAGAAIGVSAATDASKKPSTPTPATVPSVAWGVGRCVSALSNTQLYAVECSHGHKGAIVAVVTSTTLCPQSAELYVPDVNIYWCIDLDL